MQRLKKCLGIDIGHSAIKIAELSAEKTGVRITKLVVGELNVPPGPMDTERINLVSRTVKELLAKNKIATKQAVFCLQGQSVFIRRIKVPRTTEERLNRIIAYEARQQIPFALDNSLMEYQVFDYGDSPEVEVLLVAIKKDIVLEFMKVVNKTGLKPVAISVSSLALFNFHVFDGLPPEELQDLLSPKRRKSGAAKKKGGGFKFSFGKKKSAAAAAAATAIAEGEDEELNLNPEDGEYPEEDVYEEVRAFVNIGAQTFDLAIGRFGKHRSLGFTRSVPMAGNELSRSLQEKLGLDSLEAAEVMKRENAMVIVPGYEHLIGDYGANPDASEFATAWADRMILDLRKSFDFYISQPDGLAVDSILLSGGQARLRNLANYVEDKLGITVAVKDGFQSENMGIVSGSEPTEGGVAPYLVAIGLGLNGLGLGQITVDFLPTELKTIREFKKKNIELGLLGFSILLMIAVSTQIGSREVESMKNWLNTNENQLNTVTTNQAQLESARDERNKVNDSITGLGTAIGERIFWLEFLGVLESAKPPDVVLTRVSCDPTGQVDLVCETESLGSVAAFVQELRNQKDWVKEATITAYPQPMFSQLIGKEVQGFAVRIKMLSKQTRLAPARETLPPGQITPAATAVATKGGPGTF